MTAYYNEHDPQKAAWLRELIRENVIAPGEVDERSIADVEPCDLRGFIQCHFFAGIGVWSYALRLAGWPDDRPVWTGSCPCPSFSCAGKGQGFDDPRHLWPHWERLIGECSPTVIIGEQVAAAIGHGWLDLVYVALEKKAYSVGAAVLGACSVGAPHIRQRLYFCAYAASPRRQSERQHGSRSSLLSARSEQCCGIRCSCKCWRCASGGHCVRCDCLGNTGVCPDTECDGRGPDFEERDTQGRIANGRHSSVSHRPHSDGRLPSDRGLQRSGQQRLLAEDCGTGEHSHARRERLARSKSAELSGAQQLEKGGAVAEPGQAPMWLREYARLTGKTRGFWRNCDWWYGRDGKYRPIEPGIFPLAHGAANRVLKLRGYGDAIVPQVAAGFIAASCEAIEMIS